jgi:hypothetical protein
MKAKQYIPVISLLILTIAPVQPVTAEENFLAALLRFTGISVTASQVKGNNNFVEGDVWLVQIGAAQASAPQKITRDGRYHSPLWIPGSNVILAMKGEKLIQLSVQGTEEKILYTLTKNTELLGFDKSNPNLVLIIQDSLVAVLTLTNGEMTPLPYDNKNAKEREAVEQLRKDFRDYGAAKLSVDNRKEASSAGYRSIDTILIEPHNDRPVAINCPTTCSQPALVANGQQLLFIGQ